MKYDVIIFDFCGVWFTQKHCVKRLFDLRLMGKYGFLTVTCAFRNRTEDRPSYPCEDYKKCEHDVGEWALANGYEAKVNHAFYRYDGVFCLFFKVIHCKKTLMRKDRRKHKRNTMEWLETAVPIPMPISAKASSSSLPPPLCGGGSDVEGDGTESYTSKENSKAQRLAVKPTVGKRCFRRRASGGENKTITRLLDQQVMRFTVV